MIRLQEIKGIGAKTEEKLYSLGITDIKKLIEFMPNSYVDMSKFTEASEMIEGNYYRFRAKVVRINKIVRGRRVNYFSVKVDASNTHIKLMWYNQPYLYEKIKLNKEYTFFGKLKCDDGKFLFQNALFEEAEEESKLKGIIPIYRTQGLVNQVNFRKYIHEALRFVDYDTVTNGINDSMSYKEALTFAHFPNSLEEAYCAQKRLAIEELVNTILTFRYLKKLNDKDKRRKIKNIDYDRARKILSYELSKSQQQAIIEILSDIANPRPMNRMLIGDVCSGKTVVAMIVSYVAAINGYQSALMAPTTILARQHYNNFSSLCELGVRVELLTSETKSLERDEIMKQLRSGEIDIIIGTQSLISEDVEFKSLALVVFDEMHRFGVREKSDLNTKGHLVDTLVMSATPIPRALALTLYKDLDISTIYRHSKYNIDTHIVPYDKKEDMLQFLVKEIDVGRQVYIVCPRIDDIEGIELISAKAIYDELRKGVLEEYSMSLLHGKLKDDKKIQIMQDFKDRKIDVLVSTTVIEVGIDNPNATVMVVMNAESFGLATLHQLRGRIGRGEYKSFCFLMTDKASDRLKALKHHSNGLDIADIDYEIRGGGDFIGLRQKGKNNDKKYIVKINKEMILEAKNMANKIDINDIKRLLINNSEKIDEISKVVMS